MSQLSFDNFFNEGDTVSSPKTSANSVSAPVKSEIWFEGKPLSHSSMNLYQTCPQKWKFRYIDKIPEKAKSFFSFGKSVHTGLEFLFAKPKEVLPALDEVLAHYKLNWIREGYETIADERWHFQEGDRILRGFYAKHANDAARVFKVELRFDFDIEGVPLIGFIDRIDETVKGGLAIIDYKTGKAFDKSRVRQDPQLTLYQIACQKLLGKNVETLTLYHLNSLTPLTVDAHSISLQTALAKSVVVTARGIMDKKFDPKPDPLGHCQWCDYAQICPAFSGKSLPTPPRSMRSYR